MRECSKCGSKKPLDEFREYVGPKKKIYRRRVCNECMDQVATQWRSENNDRYKKWCDDYYKKTRDEQIAYSSEWNKKHPERKTQNDMTRYRRKRHEVVMAYGGYKCNCLCDCKVTEEKFLVIDHVNNDGHKYRNSVKNIKGGYKFGVHSGEGLLTWIMKNNYPSGIQILCANCNTGKARNDGLCPLVKKVQRSSRKGVGSSEPKRPTPHEGDDMISSYEKS